MIAVLTGDIIDSRKLGAPESWLPVLKDALKQSGAKESWEIYRGDSFQLSLQPENALGAAIYIKACVRTLRNTDLRLAIGIGNIDYTASRVNESNGDAFIRSGHRFESLKKDRITLAIQTPWEDLDNEINVALRLALIAMDNWSPASAALVKLSIENPGLSQLDLAKKAGKSQSSVSEALKRAHLADILELDALFRKKINALLTAG